LKLTSLVWKSWVAGGNLVASNSIEKIENSTRIWSGGQVTAGGLLDLSLGLEMTEDVLRDSSTYARRWASEWCASERVFNLSLRAISASSHHHALGGGQDDRRE